MHQERAQFRGLLPQRVPSILVALEKFLLSSQPLVSSVLKISGDFTGGDRHGALAQICSILGIQDPDKLDPNVSALSIHLSIESVSCFDVSSYFSHWIVNLGRFRHRFTHGS